MGKYTAEEAEARQARIEAENNAYREQCAAALIHARSLCSATFGERLETTRKAQKLTYAKLAELSGVNSKAIQEYVRGEGPKQQEINKQRGLLEKPLPSIDTVENLATALKIDPRWLAFG